MHVLLNWLWQGCAVAAVVSLGVWLAGGRLSAATRHQIWWATLLTILVVPVLPDVLARPVLAGPSAPAVSSAPATVVATVPAWPVLIVLACWGCWVTARTLGAIGAYRALVRARRACRPFPSARERRLHRWRGVNCRGRVARLALSDDVRLAGVLGSALPVIAVNPTLVEGLSDAELDQVLVHEWAHVQRRDDVTCALQLLVDVLGGLHPAVWWVSRRLTTDREIACDDWAVAVTGSPRTYAACLLKLAELPVTGRPPAAVPAALTARTLETRVRLLLDRTRNASPRPSAVIVMAAVPWVLVLAAVAARADVFAELAPFGEVPTAPQALRAPAGEPLATPPASRAIGLLAVSVSAEARRQRGVSPAVARELEPPTVGVAVDSAIESGRPLGGDGSPAADGQPVRMFGDAPIETGDPATQALIDAVPAPMPPTSLTTSDGRAAPWNTAAEAGLTIGRGSQKAATATAGFFSRVGRRLADSF